MAEAFFGHQEPNKYFISMTPQCLWSIKIRLQKLRNSNRHRQTLLVFTICWRNFNMDIYLLSSVWEKSTYLKTETKQHMLVTQINKQLLPVVIHYQLQQNHRNTWAVSKLTFQRCTKSQFLLATWHDFKWQNKATSNLKCPQNLEGEIFKRKRKDYFISITKCQKSSIQLSFLSWATEKVNEKTKWKKTILIWFIRYRGFRQKYYKHASWF